MMDTAILATIMAFGAAIAVIALIWYVIMVIANWKIFTKAGEAGWKSIIPVYNAYIMFKIAWKPVMFWVTVAVAILYVVLIALAAQSAVAGVIGAILYIAIAVISIIQIYKFAKAFGQGVGFTIGLILLNPIFMLILAFNSNIQYVGNDQ